jgi:Ran GTPase-activating protein (RanGAP) involved in mRNA processing and transport
VHLAARIPEMTNAMRRVVPALLMAPAICLGAGTVGLGEVESLLQQKPAIRNFLVSTLDMDPTVMAAVRFGSHIPHLGGARMGPYMVQVRPKSPKDAPPLELVICTDARFFDASGNRTDDEMKAVRLEEKLTVVMLRQINSAPAIPECP